MTLDEKVTQACHRIEELYNDTDGHCYVSFSGGKDSTVILALIKMCEEVYTIPPNAIPAVFVNTGIELGVTVDFVKWVKENYYIMELFMKVNGSMIKQKEKEKLFLKKVIIMKANGKIMQLMEKENYIIIEIKYMKDFGSTVEWKEKENFIIRILII